MYMRLSECINVFYYDACNTTLTSYLGPPQTCLQDYERKFKQFTAYVPIRRIRSLSADLNTRAKREGGKIA